MTGTSRLRGVLQPAAWAALLLIAAGCTGSSGGSATPTSVTPAISSALATEVAASPAVAATPGVAGTQVGVRDFTLNPGTVRVTGPNVAFDVKNGGPTIHNVTIRDASGKVFAFTPDLREGESATLTASLAPGTYILFCSLPGHESLGVKGTLTVTAP